MGFEVNISFWNKNVKHFVFFTENLILIKSTDKKWNLFYFSQSGGAVPRS